MQANKAEATRNPIRALREEAGLSRGEFSLLLAVGHWHISGLESGRVPHLPATVRLALRRRGFNAEQVAMDYETWVETVGQEVSDRVKSNRQRNGAALSGA